MKNALSVRWLFAVLLATVIASPSFAAYRGDEGGAKLANDSWLWSTGDFHPDRGLPNEQPIKRSPERGLDTA